MKRSASLKTIRELLLKRRDMLRDALVGELRHLNRNWELRPVGDSGDDAQEGADDEIVSRMAQAESAGDKNWCALQLARLQVNEKADDRYVREVLGRTIRDSAGRIILSSGDRDLLQGLEPYSFK